jgi:methylmalonyl-CoA mutase cobalamin-binding subunit
MEAASQTAELIETGGRQFFKAILHGLEGIGIDTKNPFEMLLALRRIGGKRLEQLYGPGEPGPSNADVRLPMVKTSPILELQNHAQRCLDAINPETHEMIRDAQLLGCLATTDVHEYGKLLLETVLQRLGVELVDAGASIDPDMLAETAYGNKVDFIALSTYNGVALDYLKRLRNEMARHKSNIPVFIGGKLNQVPDNSQDSLPVDVSHELRAAGAIVCYEVNDMLKQLAQMKRVEPKSVESP